MKPPLVDDVVLAEPAQAADRPRRRLVSARSRRSPSRSRADRRRSSRGIEQVIIPGVRDIGVTRLSPIGPNDITRGRDVEAYERDLATTFQALLRETSAVVVANLIPDLTLTLRFKGREEAAKVGRRVVQFNRALASQARTHGAEVVDLYAASRREVPRRPELIGADGDHPSDQSCARWAELMSQGVEARLPR